MTGRIVESEFANLYNDLAGEIFLSGFMKKCLKISGACSDILSDCKVIETRIGSLFEKDVVAFEFGMDELRIKMNNSVCID